MGNYLFLISFAVLFCVLHSVTASLEFKDRVKQALGEAFYKDYYRLFYSGISLVVLGGILVYSRALPDKTAWDIEPAFLFRIIQGLGVIIVLWAAKSFDTLNFLGLSHILGRKTQKEETLIITGAYRLCRHPLYLGTIIFLWAQPHMSQKYLILILIFTLYFYLGSIPEERKLKQEFGEEYRKYKKNTPRIFPFPR